MITIGYFKSLTIANQALEFIASFPDNGGKRCFKIGKCQSSSFPSVDFDEEKWNKLHPDLSQFARMTVQEMRGALRAWSRLVLGKNKRR